MRQINAEMYGQLLGQLREGNEHLLDKIAVLTLKGANRTLRQYINYYGRQNAGRLPLTGEARAKLDSNVASMVTVLGGAAYKIQKQGVSSVISSALEGMAAGRLGGAQAEALEKSLGIDIIR